MTPENKITHLENWLKQFPADHPMRPIIESDLRKLKESQPARTYEQDTFDIQNHNIYNV